MKTLKTLVTGLFILCIVVSCRKAEKEEILSENSPNSLPPSRQNIIESGWISASWNAVIKKNFAVYHTSIKAEDISAKDAEKGVVRVFKISGAGDVSSSVALPFEEKRGSQKLYWYAQPFEGSILVSVDVYGSKTNPVDSKTLFKYIVLGNEAIREFEQRGTDKADLMEMSYDKLREASR